MGIDLLSLLDTAIDEPHIVLPDSDSEDVILSKDVYLTLAQKIFNKALTYTPVDTGKLRDSIYMRPYSTGFEIGYSCEYATYVHEIGFNYHEHPTKYKYLEDAAFEVVMDYWGETGVNIPVSILYDPLSVFVGCKDSPGEKLVSIKNKQNANQRPEVLEEMWNGLINFDPMTASESDRLHYEKMAKFFNTYRRHNTWSILQEWGDRMRHQ